MSNTNPPSRKGIDWNIGEGEARANSALEHFWRGRQRGLSLWALAQGALALAIPMFVIYRGYFAMMDPRIERSVMLSLLLSYVFLRFPTGEKKWSAGFNRIFIIDLFLIFLVVATEIYTLWNIEIASTDGITVQLFGSQVRLDYIVGLVVIVLLLEGTRRSFGWLMVIVCLFFLTYALAANYMPGPLKGARATWTYLMYSLYTIDQGVYGIGADVLLSMVFVYLLFGFLLVGTKLGAFFTAAANSMVGHYSGGPAKVAVVSSAFVGMISGSVIANVATTGSFTIPLMKSIGYKPEFAGAVESCASTGGYFTPPIMGAAAFLIAVFTNTPYLKVCLYVALPAFLYFLAVLIQVHLRAKKDGLGGLPKDSLPHLPTVMSEGGHLLLPLVALVVGLILGYSVTKVAIWAIAGIILVSFVRKETRQSPGGLLVLFERATTSSVGISMAVISVGIIQGTLMTGGIGMRLSLAVEIVSGGNLVLGLLLAAVVTMILGMGVSPLLVYYIAYIFIIPPLVKIGAPEMPLHIFALMYGAVSNITPPVCFAAFTAAAISGGSPMKTGFEATKLGFACYIVPFMLVLHPELLFLEGITWQSFFSMVTATAGIVCMATTFEGWLFREVSILPRIALFAAGVLLIAQQLQLIGIGTGLLLLVVLWQKSRREQVVKTT